MNQIERALHQEIHLRLMMAKPNCVWISPPNSFFIPTRTAAERTLASRLVAQMKAGGMLTVGAPDFVFLWGNAGGQEAGCGCIELKRPASKSLLGKSPAGRLSDAQKTFRDRCLSAGIPYVVCTTWAEVRDALIEWGCLSADWKDAEQRVGRAA